MTGEDIEYKSEAIEYSDQYLVELIHRKKMRSYMTYYDNDQVHVKFYSSETQQ